MASIVKFVTYKTEIEDKRDRENFVRDSIRLKTSGRVPWSWLRNQSPVPRWNQEHAKEAGFFLDHIKPNHVSRLVWELEAEYTPIKGGQIDPDPLARPAVITYQTSLVEQPTFFDNKRRPICNTAAEFLTGVMFQISLVEYSVTKNLATDPAWLQTHLGAVNADTLRIRGLSWKPKTLLLTGASGGEFVTENRSRFSECRLTLLGDARTWTQEVWNQGTVQLAKVTKVIKGKEREVWVQVPIMDDDPVSPAPVTEPRPLDQFGVAISEHLQPDRTQPLKVQRLITLKFDTQPELPFVGVLPLT